MDVDSLVNGYPSALALSVHSIRSKVDAICDLLPSCSASAMLAKYASYST